MVTKREWLSGLRRALITTETTRDHNQQTETEPPQHEMSPNVLSTDYTEEQFEEELDRREDALSSLENSIVKHAQKYEKLLEKAIEKRGDRKVRYLMKAKKEEIKHDVKNEIYDDLMRQQLALVKILLYHKKQQMRAGGPAWDFTIDIGELPVDDMVDDIEEDTDRAQAVENVIEEIEMTMELDSEEALGIDLSDIKAEANEMEAADIADKSLDVNSEIEDDIDERIRDELEDIGEETGRQNGTDND
jgi:hypothetical protein